MYRTEDVLATLGMVRQHKLDVRTVTMGVDLAPCASPNPNVLCDRIRDRLLKFAGRLKAVCREVEGRYGIPIVNRRIAVSPIGQVAAGHSAEGCLAVARTLDAVAAEVGVDLVGGFTALVQKGWTDAENASDRGLAGGALDNRAGVCLRQRGHDGRRHQHGCHPGARIRAEGYRRANEGARRLRLRQAGHLRQRADRQPVHGRGVSRRGRARLRDQHRRQRSRRGEGGRRGPRSARGHARPPWARSPRRSRARRSASRASAS